MSTEVKKYLKDYFPPDTRPIKEVRKSLIREFGIKLGITQQGLRNIERARKITEIREEDDNLILERVDNKRDIFGESRSSILKIRERDLGNEIVFPTTLFVTNTEHVYIPLFPAPFEGYMNQIFVLETSLGSYFHMTEISNKSKDLDYPVRSVRVIRDKSKGREEMVYAAVYFKDPWVTDNLGVMTLKKEPISLIYFKDRVVASIGEKQILAELSTEEVKRFGLMAGFEENKQELRFLSRLGGIEIEVVQGKKLNYGYAEDLFASNIQQWVTNDRVNVVNFPVFSSS